MSDKTKPCGDNCTTCSSVPERVIFTEEMRDTYTILFPTMLPRHFKIISKVFNHYGYKTEL